MKLQTQSKKAFQKIRAIVGSHVGTIQRKIMPAVVSISETRLRLKYKFKHRNPIIFLTLLFIFKNFFFGAELS